MCFSFSLFFSSDVFFGMRIVLHDNCVGTKCSQVSYFLGHFHVAKLSGFRNEQHFIH